MATLLVTRFSYCWYTSDFIAHIRLRELILDAMKTSLLSWQWDKNKCFKRSIRPCNKSPQHIYLCPKSHMWNTSVERTFSLKDGHDIMNLYDIPVKCTEATHIWQYTCDQLPMQLLTTFILWKLVVLRLFGRGHTILLFILFSWNIKFSSCEQTWGQLKKKNWRKSIL